jgi:hypothetical protein
MQERCQREVILLIVDTTHKLITLDILGYVIRFNGVALSCNAISLFALFFLPTFWLLDEYNVAALTIPEDAL